jgi:predicted NAD-dependent protein-ADP-ribosyltransferase YbiA (DUF1768 family)
MLFLAAIAAAATPQQARATVRIVKAQRVNREEWENSKRKRELVVQEAGRKVTVRLIEYE